MWCGSESLPYPNETFSYEWRTIFLPEDCKAMWKAFTMIHNSISKHDGCSMMRLSELWSRRDLYWDGAWMVKVWREKWRLPIFLSAFLPPFLPFFLLLFANISWCLFCSRLKYKETTRKGYALICGGHYPLIFLNSLIPITNKKIREPSIFYYIRVAISGNKYQILICSFSPHQSFPYIWASTMAVKENLVSLSWDSGLAYCWISCGQAMPTWQYCHYFGSASPMWMAWWPSLYDGSFFLLFLGLFSKPGPCMNEACPHPPSLRLETPVTMSGAALPSLQFELYSGKNKDLSEIIWDCQQLNWYVVFL